MVNSIYKLVLLIVTILLNYACLHKLNYTTPCVAKLVKMPEDYPWSSYKFFLNDDNPTWLYSFPEKYFGFYQSLNLNIIFHKSALYKKLFDYYVITNITIFLFQHFKNLFSRLVTKL